MSRELLVLWAGRHQRDDWDRLCDGYRRRIARLRAVREVAVKVRGRGDAPDRLESEADALEAALPDPCWTVALDRDGRPRSSEELAALLLRLEREWPHPVAFVVGSDLGLAARLKDGAREVMSFGPVTLGHELARLVLYEQLYRALCINAGIKYHRESF